jgi:hypothetical protein
MEGIAAKADLVVTGGGGRENQINEILDCCLSRHIFQLGRSVTWEDVFHLQFRPRHIKQTVAECATTM